MPVSGLSCFLVGAEDFSGIMQRDPILRLNPLTKPVGAGWSTYGKTANAYQ